MKGRTVRSPYLRAGSRLCGDDDVWTGPSRRPPAGGRTRTRVRSISRSRAAPASRRTRRGSSVACSASGALQHSPRATPARRRTPDARSTSTDSARPGVRRPLHPTLGHLPGRGPARRDPGRGSRSGRHRRPPLGRRLRDRLGGRLLARALQARRAADGSLSRGAANADRRRRPRLLRRRVAVRHAGRSAASRGTPAGRSTMPSPSACDATRGASSIRRRTADGRCAAAGLPGGTRRRWARGSSSR